MDERRPFPKGALVGAAALIGFTMLVVGAARVTGTVSPALPGTESVESLALHFEDRADGAVVVIDDADERVIDVLEPGSNGFVRGALRGLARERHRRDIGPQSPFILTYWDNERVSLHDPMTGARIDLGAFGPTNQWAFARLLEGVGRER